MTKPLSFRTQIWNVRELLLRYSQMDLNPDYQREGSIWGLSRRQLFIDSILNGFDSPKLYFHDLVPPEMVDSGLHRFAVIDGRQRLETLLAFSQDGFRLAKNFRLLPELEAESDIRTLYPEDTGGSFAGLKYSDLKREAAFLSRRFDGYELSVVLVRTDDRSYIEELFFRLNEGTPLNPAEKRNRGALWREALDRLKRQPFFRCLRFSDRRGRYSDLALRLLYLEERSATIEHAPDMKMRQLDDFAAEFRPPVGTQFAAESERSVHERLVELESRVDNTLTLLSSIFHESDFLLGRSTDALTYFVVFRSDPSLASSPALRDRLFNLAASIEALEGVDEEELSSDELSVLDAFGAVQGTTTGSYLADRARIVRSFLLGDLQIRSPRGHLPEVG